MLVKGPLLKISEVSIHADQSHIITTLADLHRWYLVLRLLLINDRGNSWQHGKLFCHVVFVDMNYIYIYIYIYVCVSVCVCGLHVCVFAVTVLFWLCLRITFHDAFIVPKPCTCLSHTIDLLWEKFQWILPLCMKPISFQSKASVVCLVTAAIFIDFCLKKLNVFSQHIGQKQLISEFRRTNPHELKCWSTFCFNYFLRYYLMM